MTSSWSTFIQLLNINEKFLRCKNFASFSYEIRPQNMVRLFASNECYIHVEQLLLTRVETPTDVALFHPSAREFAARITLVYIQCEMN